MSQCLTVDCRKEALPPRFCARDAPPVENRRFCGGDSLREKPFAADLRRGTRHRSLQKTAATTEIHVVFTKPVNELLLAAGAREENGI